MGSSCRIQRLACIFVFFFIVLEPKINVVRADGELPKNLPSTYSEALGSTSVSLKNIWNSYSIQFSRNKEVVTLILSGPYTQGWVGIGFSEDGGMIGASAMIGWAGKDGKSMIKQYSLDGYTPNKVIANKGTLALTKVAPSCVVNNGTLYMAFQLSFPPNSMKQKVILALSPETPGNDGLLARHTDRTMIQIDFTQGVVASYGGERTAHGVMGMLAWQVILPLGVLFPVYFKHRDPQWFYLHMSFQITGYGFAFITAVMGLKLAADLHAEVTWHKFFGITAFLLATLQIIALCARPAKDSSARKLWNIYHHSVGYIAIFMGFSNVYLGIILANEGLDWMIVSLSILAFYVFLFLTLWGKKVDDQQNPPPVFIPS